VGAVLESLLEAKWGGPLLDRAPELAVSSVAGPVETLVEAKEAK
jgi:aspartyl-tRNA(Asn)/glutamyl-tRNA(Gln) amidotransferase subunit A